MAYNLGVALNFNRRVDCSVSYFLPPLSPSTPTTYSSMRYVLIVREHCNINTYDDYKRRQLPHFGRQITSCMCKRGQLMPPPQCS